MGQFPLNRRIEGLPGGFVLGPCPGCWLWTVEYHAEDLIWWTPQEFPGVLEDLIRNHALEDCSGLRGIIAHLGLL